MLKIRRSRDRLIFNMGIPIPGNDGILRRYIETGPCIVCCFCRYSSIWLAMANPERRLRSLEQNMDTLHQKVDTLVYQFDRLLINLEEREEQRLERGQQDDPEEPIAAVGTPTVPHSQKRDDIGYRKAKQIVETWKRGQVEAEDTPAYYRKLAVYLTEAFFGAEYLSNANLTDTPEGWGKQDTHRLELVKFLVQEEFYIDEENWNVKPEIFAGIWQNCRNNISKKCHELHVKSPWAEGGLSCSGRLRYDASDDELEPPRGAGRTQVNTPQPGQHIDYESTKLIVETWKKHYRFEDSLDHCRRLTLHLADSIFGVDVLSRSGLTARNDLTPLDERLMGLIERVIREEFCAHNYDNTPNGFQQIWGVCRTAISNKCSRLRTTGKGNKQRK